MYHLNCFLRRQHAENVPQHMRYFTKEERKSLSFFANKKETAPNGAVSFFS